MPSVTIPLVGAPNRRGYDSDGQVWDQRFIGVLFDVVKNPITGNTTVYCQRRPGFTLSAAIAGASGLNGIGVFNSPSTAQRITAYINSSTHVVTIFRGTTSAGTVTAATEGGVFSFAETIISGTTYYLFVCTNGTDKGGWYLADDATTQTSYTGNTNSNTTVDNIASTAGMYAGQAISGTDIPAGTRIASVDSGTAITITQAATGTTVGVTLTKTPIAKIIDADFPASTVVGSFVEMDGYIFIMTSDGKVYHSDLNSVSAWSASAFITANMATDAGRGLARSVNQIIAFGNTSIEQFYNAGNPSGSVLGRTEQLFKKYGMFGSASDGEFQMLATVGNYIAFVGQEMNNDYGSIYIISGTEIRRVSNPIIDRVTPYTGFDQYTIDGFSFGGNNYLLLNYGSYSQLRESWLYCFETGMWSESGFPYFMRMSPTGATTAITVNATDGNVYKLDGSNSWDDDTVAYTVTMQTSMWYPQGAEGKRVFVSRVDLLGDVHATGGVASLETNDNDYNASNWVSRGNFDLTRTNPKVERCGSFVGGRAYRIKHSVDDIFRAWGLRITYEVGEH